MGGPDYTRVSDEQADRPKGFLTPELEIRPAAPLDLAGLGAELLHAAATDPDGFLVARAHPEGPVVGRGVAVLRGETLLLLDLFVSPPERGHGIGTALFFSLKAYGRSRGARAFECAPPNELSSVAFLLKREVPLRSLVCRLSTNLTLGDPPRLRSGEWTLSPVPLGPALSGWVADLDREVRGFARTAEWNFWLKNRKGNEVWALRRHGRPEGIARLSFDGKRASLGPIQTGRAADFAAIWSFLLSRARALGAESATVAIPAASRLGLAAAYAANLRLVETTPFFSTLPRGDLRRYSGSGGVFF